jgi:hypothetical protein
VTWGDGIVEQAPITLIAPERYAISASHVWTKPGRYRVTVTVTDSRNSRRITATTDALITPAMRQDPVAPAADPVQRHGRRR